MATEAELELFYRRQLTKLRELVEFRKAGESALEARQLIFRNGDVPADYDVMTSNILASLRADAKYYDKGDGVSIRNMERRISAML